MGLQGSSSSPSGNTPMHYAPDPANAPQQFHNDLCLGRVRTRTARGSGLKGGTEEGVESLAQSAIFAPVGSGRGTRRPLAMKW